jgi:hypothetical protein
MDHQASTVGDFIVPRFLGEVFQQFPFRGDAMNAAGARKRVKRLTTLIDGLTKEEEAMQTGLGVLTREE